MHVKSLDIGDESVNRFDRYRNQIHCLPALLSRNIKPTPRNKNGHDDTSKNSTLRLPIRYDSKRYIDIFDILKHHYSAKHVAR